MSNQLEFKPCPHCGKSVRSNAITCHRCQKPLGLAKVNIQVSKEEKDGYNEGEEQASKFGGYDAKQDDFDYDEYLSDEFGTPRKKAIFTWRTVAWVMVFVMIAPVALMAYQLWLIFS
jgi:hypothetical protein